MVRYWSIKLNTRKPLSFIEYVTAGIYFHYYTQIYISEIGFNYYSFLLTNQSDDINIYKITNRRTEVTLMR